MSSKPANYLPGFAKSDAKPDSGVAVDDFPSSYAMRALMIVVGLYLLVTVLAWRAGLWRARRRRISRKPRATPVQHPLWVKPASID